MSRNFRRVKSHREIPQLIEVGTKFRLPCSMSSISNSWNTRHGIRIVILQENSTLQRVRLNFLARE